MAGEIRNKLNNTKEQMHKQLKENTTICQNPEQSNMFFDLDGLKSSIDTVNGQIDCVYNIFTRIKNGIYKDKLQEEQKLIKTLQDTLNHTSNKTIPIINRNFEYINKNIQTTKEQYNIVKQEIDNNKFQHIDNPGQYIEGLDTHANKLENKLSLIKIHIDQLIHKLTQTTNEINEPLHFKFIPSLYIVLAKYSISCIICLIIAIISVDQLSKYFDKSIEQNHINVI